MYLSQPQIVSAILREVSRQAKQDGEPDLVGVAQMNAVIRAADLVKAAFDVPDESGTTAASEA